jgi:AraC-like DNA-binding protein
VTLDDTRQPQQGFSRARLPRLGRREFAGGRDADFFSANLAENYMRDDLDVMRRREPMIDKAELVRNPDGTVDWFCTTKLPMLDASSRAIGVCGITRDVKKMASANMLDDYASPLEMAALAEKIGLSVSQFDRKFRKRFHTTPRAYLMNIRLSAACHLLVETDLKIAAIAFKRRRPRAAASQKTHDGRIRGQSHGSANERRNAGNLWQPFTVSAVHILANCALRRAVSGVRRTIVTEFAGFLHTLR